MYRGLSSEVIQTKRSIVWLSSVSEGLVWLRSKATGQHTKKKSGELKSAKNPKKYMNSVKRRQEKEKERKRGDEEIEEEDGEMATDGINRIDACFKILA